MGFRRWLKGRLRSIGLDVSRSPLRLRRVPALGTGSAAVPRRTLPSGHFETVPVAYREPTGSLVDVAGGVADLDKWHHYFDVYQRELQPFVDRPVRLLEIGVFRGGSLEMWRRWLPTGSTVVGIDIDPATARFDAPGRGVHVRIGDQRDSGFLATLVDEFGPFDVIVDDGGHTTGQMVDSFGALFDRGLRSPGLYVVEDTHTNYMEQYVDTRHTFMELVSGLVDLVHEPYVGLSSIDVLRGDSAPAPLEMSRLGSTLARIAVYDSIVVVEKGRRPRPFVGRLGPERPR